jgi:hypothetical protein
MNRISIADLHRILKAQGVSSPEHSAFKCPACGSIQSPADLIAAGAGKDFAEVEKYAAFSCVGRWTNAGPPRAKPDGRPCNWTLGGLLTIHKLEVMDAEGKPHPFMEPATPLEAQHHERTRSKP